MDSVTLRKRVFDKGKGFNEARAQKVIVYVRKFLEESFTLDNGSWNKITGIKVNDNDIVFLEDKKEIHLKNKIFQL